MDPLNAALRKNKCLTNEIALAPDALTNVNIK